MRNMQLHFSCDTFLQSCKLLEKSNYFEGCCFCQQQSSTSWRRLRMLLVVKQGCSTSVWVMAFPWFPSFQPLSISPTSRRRSLWYLWKVGKLPAHFRNEMAHGHRHRRRWAVAELCLPPHILTFCHTDQALSTQ